MSCGYRYRKPQTCTTCGNAVCESCEAFCQGSPKDVDTHKQSIQLNPEFSAGIAAWDTELAKKDIIIKMWNPTKLSAMASWLARAAKFGVHPSSTHGVGYDNHPYITADMFKDMWEIMHTDLTSSWTWVPNLNGGGVGPNGTSVPVPEKEPTKNDVIYGTWLRNLILMIKNAKFAMEACNKCNTGCDCNCQTCNACDGCEYSVCWDCDCYW